MLEIGRDLDLGQEALAAEDGGELGVQDLDGDLAAVLEVFGEVDGGHATLAQLAPHAVPVGDGRGEAGRGAGHGSSGCGERPQYRCDGRRGPVVEAP